MGVGWSDGKYFDSEMESAIHDYMLDPVQPGEKYDDQPTQAQQSRDGSVFRTLKGQEGQMEQDSQIYNDYKPAEGLQAPVHDIAFKNSEGSDTAFTKMFKGLGLDFNEVKDHTENLQKISEQPADTFNQRWGDTSSKMNYSVGDIVSIYKDKLLTGVSKLAQDFKGVLERKPLPSKAGVPGSAAENDPEANDRLGALFQVAALAIAGSPARASLSTAESFLASLDALARDGVFRDNAITGALARVSRMTVGELDASSRAFLRSEARNIGEISRTGVATYGSDLLRSGTNPGNLFRNLPRIVQDDLRDWTSSGSYAPQYIQAHFDNIANTFKQFRFENSAGVKGVVVAHLDGDTARVSVGRENSSFHDLAMLHTMGISGMRNLLNQVKEAYPEAKYIAGWRVTGANPNREAVMALPGR